MKLSLFSWYSQANLSLMLHKTGRSSDDYIKYFEHMYSQKLLRWLRSPISLTTINSDWLIFFRFSKTTIFLIFGRFAIRAISVFRVKFNVEFTHQAANFFLKSHNWIKVIKKNKQNTNNIVFFYPERALESHFKVNCQNCHCVSE